MWMLITEYLQMKSFLNNLKNRSKQRVDNFCHNEMSAVKMAMHTVIGVGTITRCVRVALNLGRPLTPFDLGIMAAAIAFESLRAEVIYRIINN